jgi:outer membrane lipoprotein-sorting protein
MNAMKRIALMLAFALMATMSVAAQEKKTEAPKADAKPAAPAAGLPTVDEILDKYVKASGGKEAIQKQTSRTTKGTFEIESMGMTGPIQMYAKAPNKSAMVIEIPNVGTFNEVFDGTKAWSANPMSGLREKSGAELAAQKRDSDFYQPINLKSQYSKMIVKGKEKVGASEAYVIEATPAEGGPEKLYFDAASGLLVRQDAERESEQGKIAVEIYYEDYKEVDGVKVAHTLKQVTPMFSMTLKLTEVKHNTPIDDAKFNKPSN